MRSTLNWIAVSAVLAGALLAAPMQAVAQSSEDLRVDVNLRDADLIAATRMLTTQTGLQFLVEPSDLPYPKITLSLAGVTASEAIRYICQAANCFARRDENGVYIISRTKPIEQPDPRLAAPVVAPKTKITKIKLMKADAQDVYLQLRGVPFDPTRGFIELNNFEQAMDPLRRNPLPQGGMWVMGAMDQNNQPTFQPVSTQSYTQPRTGMETGSNIRLPGEAGGQEGLGGIGGGGAGQGFGGGAGQGFGGDQGGGQGGAQGQGLATGGLIPAFQFITFDPNDNSIVVQGTDEQIRELQDAIAFFDVAPKQVLVKVEFVTTSSSYNKSLGFEFFYQRGPLFVGPRPGSFARSTDTFFASYATGNVSMRLRHELLEGSGKVVTAPVLRTLNNQFATAQFQSVTTLFIPRTTITPGGGASTVYDAIPLNAPVSLAVKPRINGDGTITMFMNPTVSQFGQIRSSPDGRTAAPDRAVQTVSMVTRVKSGETIVLAGLTRKADQGQSRRFPILGDLPIIGQFFRSSATVKSLEELLIFVTPTVIEDEENLGLGP